MAVEIALFGEFESGKSAFVDLLLGVSVLPEDNAKTNLPVIKMQAGRSAGVWLRQTPTETTMSPILWWAQVPQVWSGFEHVEMTIEGHPLFNKGIVIWNTPAVDSHMKYQQEHLHKFISEREDKLSSVLFFVPGILTPSAVKFLKSHPTLLPRLTIVIAITERSSSNEIRASESKVRAAAKRELNDVPVKLLYVGDICENFYTIAHRKREMFTDGEMIAHWKEIRIDVDGMPRKFETESLGYRCSDLVEATVKWESIDYSDFSEPDLLQYAENEVRAAQFEMAKRLRAKGDFAGAIRYFRILAEAGNAEAMYLMSRCYTEREAGSLYIEESLKWNRSAADAGIADAQYVMYQFYSDGKYFKPNIELAVAYLHEAADAGHTAACAQLGRIYLAGIDIAVNYELGVKYLTSAVDAGDAGAMYALADSYKKGYGVKKDITEMVKLLERAAELDHPDAMAALGEVYYAGTDMRQDKVKAFRYFLRAADCGVVEAQLRAGACYEYGEGTAPDPELAIKYYTKAAERGDPMAQYALGALLGKEGAATSDADNAKYWLRLSAASGNMQAAELLTELEKEIPPEVEPRSGPCFVVTAAFGDEMAPEVIFYKHFRDTVLKPHPLGKTVVGVYYKVGPAFARLIACSPGRRTIARQLLRGLQSCITALSRTSSTQ